MTVNLLAAAAAATNVPVDTVIIGAISALLGIVALINASKAKQQHAIVEGHAANIKAFDQAAQFYQSTYKAQSEQSAQLAEENRRLQRQNVTLTRQLDRFERLIRDLNIALPDEWQRGEGP